jgi:hypothetical protein
MGVNQRSDTIKGQLIALQRKGVIDTWAHDPGTRSWEISRGSTFHLELKLREMEVWLSGALSALRVEVPA